jgi:adenylate cyclase
VPKVRFIPPGKEREIKTGATIISAANQLKLPLGQSCNGDGICGWCKVRVVEGNEHLAPPGELEKKLFQTYGFEPEERAACLARVRGDVTVTTSYW